MTTTVERRLRRAVSRVIDSNPFLRGAAMRAWSGYIRLYPELANGVALRRVGVTAPIDPFTVVHIDPDRIEFMVESDAMPRQTRANNVFPDSKFKYAGAVIGGDWDRTEHRFADSELYRSFVAHFEDGVEWAETPFFDTVVEHLSDGTVLWGCTTPGEFQRRCRELDRLYDAIDRQGFLSQEALQRQSVPNPIGNSSDQPPLVQLVNHELAVCLGRDGDFLFLDGRDRLAIAKILDLDSIPVWIVIRHRQWQDRRTAVADGRFRPAGLADDQRSHPDLRGLEPS